MAKKRTNPKRLKVSEQLKVIVETCGVTRYRLAREIGVAESTLSRFIHGERTLSSKAIDALGEYLGLEIVMHNPKQ